MQPSFSECLIEFSLSKILYKLSSKYSKVWLHIISAYAWAAPCLSVVLEVDDSMIYSTNLKYCSADLMPILVEMRPMAIEAILLIYCRGSQMAIFRPVMMILRQGRRSQGLEMSSTMLPITWHAPAFRSELRPLRQQSRIGMIIDREGGSMQWLKLVFRRISIAFSEYSKGFYSAQIRMSTHQEISGFLMVCPIRFSAQEAFSLIVGWALLRQLERLGTMMGRDVWSCLAELLAMTPRIQMQLILTLQFCSSSSPFSSWGRSILTEKELIFKMRLCPTFLARFLTSSALSAMQPSMISMILMDLISMTLPKFSMRALMRQILPFFSALVLVVQVEERILSTYSSVYLQPMPLSRPEKRQAWPTCCSSFMVPIVLKMWLMISMGFLKKDMRSGMHLDMALWSLSLLLLNSSVILFSTSCRFLLPSRQGARTPRKMMLLTPLDLLMKLQSTSSSFSACSLALRLMMSMPTSTASLLRVANQDFEENLVMSTQKTGLKRGSLMWSMLMVRKKGSISSPSWSKPQSNSSSEALSTILKMASALSAVSSSLMNRHSFSMVSLEFFWTNFFMLKVSIECFSSMSETSSWVANLLISSLNSSARILSLMNSSNSGLYLVVRRVRVWRMSFLVGWMKFRISANSSLRRAWSTLVRRQRRKCWMCSELVRMLMLLTMQVKRVFQLPKLMAFLMHLSQKMIASFLRWMSNYMFQSKLQQSSFTNSITKDSSRFQSIVNLLSGYQKGSASSSLRKDQQWFIILMEGVMPEFRKEKNSPRNYACLMKILDQTCCLLCQAVKMELRFTSLQILCLCSGYLVINRMLLRFLCQSLISSWWSTSVFRNRVTILSKRDTILRKCLRYFSSLTSCSLIILTSKLTPRYTFLGFSSSTLWICLSTRTLRKSASWCLTAFRLACCSASKSMRNQRLFLKNYSLVKGPKSSTMQFYLQVSSASDSASMIFFSFWLMTTSYSCSRSSKLLLEQLTMSWSSCCVRSVVVRLAKGLLMLWKQKMNLARSTSSAMCSCSFLRLCLKASSSDLNWLPLFFFSYPHSKISRGNTPRARKVTFLLNYRPATNCSQICLSLISSSSRAAMMQRQSSTSSSQVYRKAIFFWIRLSPIFIQGLVRARQDTRKRGRSPLRLSTKCSSFSERNATTGITHCQLASIFLTMVGSWVLKWLQIYLTEGSDSICCFLYTPDIITPTRIRMYLFWFFRQIFSVLARSSLGSTTSGITRSTSWTSTRNSSSSVNLMRPLAMTTRISWAKMLLAVGSGQCWREFMRPSSMRTQTILRLALCSPPMSPDRQFRTFLSTFQSLRLLVRFTTMSRQVSGQLAWYCLSLLMRAITKWSAPFQFFILEMNSAQTSMLDQLRTSRRSSCGRSRLKCLTTKELQNQLAFRDLPSCDFLSTKTSLLNTQATLPPNYYEYSAFSRQISTLRWSFRCSGLSRASPSNSARKRRNCGGSRCAGQGKQSAAWAMMKLESAWWSYWLRWTRSAFLTTLVILVKALKLRRVLWWAARAARNLLAFYMSCLQCWLRKQARVWQVWGGGLWVVNSLLTQL